mmetsp:Transcript_5733/g.12680  ORF Transcript_5733/g.12680 Transcript_5733/m.12680 type:complete len:87 (-) Transcript_5733:681-941(-)
MPCRQRHSLSPPAIPSNATIPPLIHSWSSGKQTHHHSNIRRACSRPFMAHNTKKDCNSSIKQHTNPTAQEPACSPIAVHVAPWRCM